MPSELGHLIQVGRDIIAIRHYVCATGTILFYDYLLTLADEIKYVWPEKKSCAFWLFMLNRYFPMVYQLWQFAVTYSPQSRLGVEVCNKTAFYPAFSFIICTLLAQVVLTLRMYAVTMKNTPITVGFVIITICQFGLGAMCVVIVAKRGAQTLPQMPLEAYHLCVFVQHRTLEIAYAGISLFYDFLAFSLTIFFISRSKKTGYKLSTMLRTIAEDATRYFLFIFTSHFVLAMVLSFGRESVQFLSSSAAGNVVFLPVMVSRLMLSLRKAAHPQRGSRSSAGLRIGIRSFRSMRFLRPLRSTNSGENDIRLDTVSSRSFSGRNESLVADDIVT